MGVVVEPFPTEDQRAGIVKVAKAYGWDRKTNEELGLILWALFHYYVMRRPRP